MNKNPNYAKTVLDNGMTILTERIEFFRSVSMGIIFSIGSRHEEDQKAGVAHFLEHTFFKGTKHRTARQIAEDLDSIGGAFEAFTSKESMAFTLKILDEKLEKALDIVSDILMHPLFDAQLVELERNVILEEIKGIVDDPESYIHEMLSSVMWKNHPLGRCIAGTQESVSRLAIEDLREFYERYFHPANIHVSVVGNVEHDYIVSLFESRFTFPSSTHRESPSPQKPVFNGDTWVLTRPELSQVQLNIGFEGISHQDERRFILGLCSTILGGGMSSRLFQEIREKHGLVYAIYTHELMFNDCGSFAVSAACSANNTNKVIDLIFKELSKMVSQGITTEELQRTKAQLKSNMVIALENPLRRMIVLAQYDLYFGKFFSIDEVLGRIDRIGVDDILGMANYFLESAPAMAVLGPISRERLNVSV